MELPLKTAVAPRAPNPILALIVRRAAQGILTLLLVSVIVFLATQVLPGNAAYAILGRSATTARVHQLEVQLDLNRSIFAQYWSWLSGILRGHLGNSLSNGQGVAAFVGPRFADSAILIAIAGLIGTTLGMALGALAAVRRDGILDHALAIVTLALTALPEFVIGISLVLIFATNVWHVLPAISLVPPGTSVFDVAKVLVLPAATLVLVIVPYIARMMRAAMVEALESDYVEMARLKGLSSARIILRHALPNAIAPTIQVVGITFLYLAGGIVVVEYVFDYPGIGQGLVQAVSNRDIPVIQFIVVALAAFYVVVNIATDVIALMATPRRRFARS